MTVGMRALPLLFAAALALAGCSRPEPPEITQVSGKVTSIDPSGIGVQATIEARNPNDFDLEIKSFTAKLTLDNNVDLGNISGPNPVKLPKKKKTKFNVPISIKWRDAAALAPIAASGRDVPYVVDGTVELREPVEMSVPFKVTGTVTHAQIMQAVGKSTPKVQGLPIQLPF